MSQVRVDHTEEVFITKKQLGFILTILTIVSIIFSAALATGVKSQEIDQQGKQIEDLQARSEMCTEKLNEHKATMQVINTKLDRISEDIKEIKQDVKDINRGGQ